MADEGTRGKEKFVRTRKFEALLREKAEEIAKLATSEETGLREPADVAVQSALERDAGAEESVRSINAEILREIEYAFVRITRGEYGTCEDCGRDIRKDRLTAAPWARLCINCEKLREFALER